MRARKHDRLLELEDGRPHKTRQKRDRRDYRESTQMPLVLEGMLELDRRHSKRRRVVDVCYGMRVDELVEDYLDG